ncbi:MAG TPA: phosphohydrolase [Anaeromyxobacteraceae bacterium]|jgi:hypothetical protein
MVATGDRFVLPKDLADRTGRVIARGGDELSPTAVASAAARARPGPPHPLAGSLPLGDVRTPFGAAAFRHLFRVDGVQAAVERTLLAARLPRDLHEALRLMREIDAERYQHALATAAVATRMLLAAVGEQAALPDLAAAALLHDLGMSYLDPQLLRLPRLDAVGAKAVSVHPLLGALHLATDLGAHPAVDAALAHHWRRGKGYPRLAIRPPRSVEVIAVASAFAALTHARPFRSSPYDARGATDVLITDSRLGVADLEAVQLLVHALRGARGDVRMVRFGRERLGHAPSENRHGALDQAGQTMERDS